jgi:hypothetical protein
MTSLEILKEELKEQGVELPTYTINPKQIKLINKIISKEKEEDIDYHFPQCSNTSFPVYLDPYGTRIFIPKDNQLIIECYNCKNELVKTLLEECKLDDKKIKDFCNKINTILGEKLK